MNIRNLYFDFFLSVMSFFHNLTHHDIFSMAYSSTDKLRLMLRDARQRTSRREIASQLPHALAHNPRIIYGNTRSMIPSLGHMIFETMYQFT